MIGYAFNSTFSVQIFQPLSSDLTGAEKVCTLTRQTRRITVVYILATLIVYMGVMAVTPLVLPRYAGALPYFTILTVYGLLQCIYLQYCNYLFYYKKTRNLMYITFGTSLLHVALSYCLTPYALHLTCATYIIIQTLIVLLVYVQSQRLIQQNLTDETTKD